MHSNSVHRHLVLFCTLILLSLWWNAVICIADKPSRRNFSKDDTLLKKGLKPFPMVFPDSFVINFKVTNRDDVHLRFEGTAAIRKKEIGLSHIKLTSNTVLREIVSARSDTSQQHKQILKRYFFDSSKFAFREVTHENGSLLPSSSKLASTSPFEFHKLIDIIENSSYLIPDDSSVYDIAVNTLCSSRKFHRLIVFFEHQHYVLCVDKQRKPFIVSHIINNNFIVNITRFIPVSGEQPLLTGLNPEDEQYFPRGTLNFTKTEQEKILLSNPIYNTPEKAYIFDHKYSCSLAWLRDDHSCSSLKEEDPKQSVTNRTCIFLHGVGQWPSQAGPPVNSFPDYWGKVNSYTPQCTERWFIREETKYRGWNNTDLQKSYCNLSLINNTGNVIQNKIIFSHSMGTLILAGGIQNGFCKIDPSSVSWYDVMGPLHGSKASLFLKEICVRANTWTDPSIYKIVADEGGYCIGGNSTDVFPAYGTLSPDFPGIQELVKYVSPYVTGQMCGTSAYGLNSIYSVPLFLLSEVVGYGEVNDGMVPLSSCQVFPDKPLSQVYSDSYYAVSANHADGTCRDGDAWWGNSKPCSYYTNKV
ncbi:hypothetical protein FDP41_005137 [Naegleria fowleri]|uniref:Uncharacterized protein n=1 Tax=Naegleria fowleri TaxID=5763 RepID=A0A6A5BPF6_NAEFO|nr:uncharacterized protein FDP41_005137 [Naegleria fowleri]KAF0975810.1 hypothetical protein FDP41_005137 [Naegleria fowleri]